MGCDIHMLIQKRSESAYEKTYYGDWVVVPPRVRKDWVGHDEFDWMRRQYSAFAVLADVRNNGDYVPISQPRGFPEDFDKSQYENFSDGFSELLKKHKIPMDDLDSTYRLFGFGGYFGDNSFSWVTLDEVIDALPKQPKPIGGLVELVEWLRGRYPDTDPKDIRLVFGFDS